MGIKGLKNRFGGLQSLIALALISEFAYIGIASLENIGEAVPRFFLFFGAAFTFYWLAARAFFALDGGAKAPTRWGWQRQLKSRRLWLNDFIYRERNRKRIGTREALAIGLLFGLIFRITLLLTSPSLSDDIYRYIWDGRVAAHGINPFHYPPQALPLSQLRDDEIYPRINHKEISTVYPPVSQMVFRGIYALSPTVLGFKAAFLLLDCLTAMGLFLILRRLKLDPRRLLLYWWNPLLIVEISGSGHADILGIFFLTAALFFLLRRDYFATTSVLVLSFLTKFVSVFILPVLFWLKKENKLLVPLVFLILTALFYLPYADAGSQLFAGLSVYAEKWQFNSSVFWLLVKGAQSALRDEWVVKWFVKPAGAGVNAETIASFGLDFVLKVSKIVIAVAFSGMLLVFLRRLRDDLERDGDAWLFSLGLALFGAFLILAPTVHPWYACWLLPFLVIRPNRAWLAFTGLCALSYWILDGYAKTGVWQESPVIRFLEYAPFYALLIYDWMRSRRGSRGESLTKVRA